MSDLSPERINLQEKDKHYADTSWRDQMDWRGFVFEFGNSSAFKGAALQADGLTRHTADRTWQISCQNYRL